MNYIKGIKMTQFKEHETWDLESFLGVDKSDHNLEDQIDSLIDQIRFVINGQADKNSLIEDYNDWVKDREAR
jgi:hypothetical protein